MDSLKIRQLKIKESNDENSRMNFKNIEDLDDNLLCIILSNLPIVDRVKCERVNRRWKVVASQQSWKTMRYLNLNPILWGLKPQGKSHQIKTINEQGLESVLIRCGRHLEEIDVANSYWLERKLYCHLWQMVSSYCSNCLKSITIGFTLTKSGIKLLTKACMDLSLQKLCIKNLYDLKKPEVQKWYFSNLKSMETVLGNFFKVNKSLQHLELKQLFLYYGECLLKLPFELETIIIDNELEKTSFTEVDSLSDNLAKLVRSCKNLKKFVYRGTMKVDVLISALETTTNLFHLELKNDIKNMKFFDSVEKKLGNVFLNNSNLKTIKLGFIY